MLAGDPALDFANTLHWREGRLVDFIPDYISLIEWCYPAGLLAEAELRLLLDRAGAWYDTAEAAHISAIDLRHVWREYLAQQAGSEAKIDGGQGLCARLAETLGDGGLQAARMSAHSGEATALLMLPVRRITLAITSLELIPVERRIGRCEGEPCGGYFLDSSRSRPRRWCSMDTCGNRAKVRGFRGRMRADEVTSSGN
ncbi:CGNR zinc finger domain-containing protein [Neorhizobium sp. IRAMC:178]|uniref:CGNR zinc finger domain-containing protein n=1 Tax=Neorhizobium tunisiense TaxID=3144793 RepID=UPI0031F6073E